MLLVDSNPVRSNQMAQVYLKIINVCLKPGSGMVLLY